MKKTLFLLCLLVCVGACSNNRSDNEFYHSVVEEFIDKVPPSKTVLGIDYNMTYEEMMEYLFFLGETNESIVGGADNTFFVEETKGKSKEEKRKLYLEKYSSGKIMYRIYSKEDQHFLFGEISVLEPTNLRYGVDLTFKDKIEKIEKVVYPIYLKKYGQPIFISKDKKKHVWIDGTQLIEYIKEKKYVTIIYSDAVLFAKEFKELSTPIVEHKENHSKDL